MGWYTKSKRTSYDMVGAVKYRAVKWPEGAPVQQGVPHAGALVRVKGFQSKQYQMLSGIPYKDQNQNWRIHVQRAKKREHTMDVRLVNITPWHEDKEPCYTEAQIRGAIGDDPWLSEPVGDRIIDNLKEDKCDDDI